MSERAARGDAVPVRSHLGWALFGTGLAMILLLLDVRASGDGMLRPIRAGARGPSAAVIARDFPHAVEPDGVGLDGQQFYAIARDPFHPAAVAPGLGAPRYRYQRILYPVLAWVLHPSGGGPGLVLALVAVSALGLSSAVWPWAASPPPSAARPGWPPSTPSSRGRCGASRPAWPTAWPCRSRW